MMSSQSSSLPSFEQTYRRRSGVPFLSTIRNATARERLAGKSATGTLTRPKLIVPLQNERTGAGCSGTLPPAEPREARLQRVRQFLLPGGARTERHDLRLPPVRLRFDQIHHAIAIVIAELRRV